MNVCFCLAYFSCLHALQALQRRQDFLKKSWRGVGGEGAAPPPHMHMLNMLRDSLAVRPLCAQSEGFIDQ